MGTLSQQVDDDEWPLVVIRPASFGNGASLTALTDGICEILDQRRQLCLIADFSHKTCVELPEVRHLAELFRSQGERIDTLVLALAVVAPSAMVRGAMKLVFQARPPNLPLSVVRTHREAKKFVGPYLAELTTSVTSCMTRLAAVGH